MAQCAETAQARDATLRCRNALFGAGMDMRCFLTTFNKRRVGQWGKYYILDLLPSTQHILEGRFFTRKTFFKEGEDKDWISSGLLATQPCLTALPIFTWTRAPT